MGSVVAVRAAILFVPDRSVPVAVAGIIVSVVIAVAVLVALFVLVPLVTIGGPGAERDTGRRVTPQQLVDRRRAEPDRRVPSPAGARLRRQRPQGAGAHPESQ